MRCHEARHRLTSLVGPLTSDGELQNHLQSCSACARLANAANALKRYLSAAGELDTTGGLTFQELRNLVQKRASLAEQPRNKESTVMRALLRPLRRNPGLGIGIATAVLVLSLATLVPFSYDRTIGYEVAFAAVDPSLALDNNRINQLLGKLGVDEAVIDVTDCEVTCNLTIGHLSSPTEARLVRAAFAGWNAVKEEGYIVPVNVSCSGNLIKFASDGRNTVRIDLSTTSDEEIQQMLKSRLGDDFDCNIFFSADTVDGSVTMSLDLVGGNCGAESFVGDGDDSIMIKTIVFCGDSAKVGSHCNGIDPTSWMPQNDSMSCSKIVVSGGSDGSATCFIPGMGQVDCKTLSEEDLQQLRDQGFDVDIVDEPGGLRKIVLRKGETSLNVHEPDLDSGNQLEAAKPAQLPDGYELGQNYPNPFNPTTSISFTLPQSAPVQLEIFNVNGRSVRTLVNTTLPAGTHEYEWDATADNGNRVASGVYFYRLTAGDIVSTRRMTLLK